MELNKIYNEPCLETLGRMENNSIDCVISSPPYWQLRDYGYEGQWGLEPTYQLYLEHLWSMMDEIYRVLKLEGSCWINLGDTYNGSKQGNTQGTYKDEIDKTKAWANNLTITKQKQAEADKCLLLIPHRFAIGCIERGWIMRNDCIWAKRNAMPESCTDRFSKKHEYFFFMVKSEKYYFDLDAIRDKAITNENRPDGIVRNRLYGYDSKMNRMNGVQPQRDYENGFNGHNQQQRGGTNDKGKNPGSVSDFWDVPTKPSSSEHYASYNDFLLKKPVLAGCPKGGIIYDPFMGTGSTAEVAIRSDRHFVGSEMSKDYCAIAEKRLKPFLQQTNLFYRA